MKRIFLKELCKTSCGISQLEREVETMRKLTHLNIVQLKEVLHLPNKSIAYLIMEYADSGNLLSFIEKGYKFSIKEIKSIFKQLCLGIEYLHNNFLVHQDLKPANILLKSNGIVLISDFGVGHSFQSAAMVVGTPAYQAPEVIDDCLCDFDNFDDHDPSKEDIWSLGVTLYELLFGMLPFYGANVFEIVRSISTIKLEPPTNTDPLLWDLILKMLTVNPFKRITIKEILNHPFLISNESNEFFNFPILKFKNFNSSLEIFKIDAIICSNNYSFILNDPITKKQKRSFTLSFL